MEVTIEEFNDLNEEQRMRLNKKQLINLILTANPNIDGLTKAIKELTETVDGFKKQSEENSNSIVALKVQLELAKNESHSLLSRVNQLEQRSRNVNLEITGLRPPNPDETETSLVLEFLKNAAKIEVNKNDVDACHEVPSKRTDNKRIVIIALKNRSLRDEVLSHKKNLIIYNRDKPNPVFMNEHLSPYNKKLFAGASKRKREKEYQFIWTKKGVTFVRKEPGSPAIRIRSEEDLNLII